MSATTTKWVIEADYLQGCNCDYGCPCEFSAPPTLGNCEAVGAWKINRGNFGGVRLDDLGLAFAARWPKAIHEGNGTICLFIDEHADAAQREALLTICSGQAGGMPFEILVTTFSKFLDPHFVPFKFILNGRDSRVDIGNAMKIGLAPIKNPVTGLAEDVSINHGTGFIFKEAECVSAEEMTVTAGELTFAWPKKAGFVAKIRYSN
jgi:hypothetical protein